MLLNKPLEASPPEIDLMWFFARVDCAEEKTNDGIPGCPCMWFESRSLS